MKFISSIKRILSILPLISCFPALQAQEQLVPLDGNPVLQQFPKPGIKIKSVQQADTLELPFFDDFSNSSVFPDPLKWQDKNVFINDSYGKEPPSVGVATLDGIDSKGEFYSSAGYGNPFSSDTLTSVPLNLNYPGNKNIYLSFYYQGKGNGDYPETSDSLILEFYSPLTQAWEKIWSKEGDTISAFRQKIVQVWPDKFLQKGFRFRFRNIVTLSGDQEASRAVNADHWNLDYIKLDKNRNAGDTIHHDLAFVYPLASALKNYEQMPWKHFKINTTAELASTVTSVFRNNDNVTRSIIRNFFVFYDYKGYHTNDTLDGGADNYDPGIKTVFKLVFTYPFLSNNSDSASFSIKAKFITDDFDYSSNNEITYKQGFYDFYSYDDGTAEAGYGLTGDGTQNAMLAYQFNCKKQDTLKAVQMYFNRSLLDKSQKYFYLVIWDDNNGEPGSVIYRREGVRPEYENDLNRLHTYYIDDTTLVLDGVFYVGWQQTTTDMLNIGFDFNRKRNQHIFYNINGSWENSKFEGALMIRPFFGKMLTTSSGHEIKKTAGFRIFPNPSYNQIYLKFENAELSLPLTISIYSLTGNLVLKSRFYNNSPIDISQLGEGTYILQLTGKNNKFLYSGKFIKTR